MKHMCHAYGCTLEVEPKFLMCGSHWSMVPSYLQQLIYQTYHVGQEVNKNPSRTWLRYAKQAILYVKDLESNY